MGLFEEEEEKNGIASEVVKVPDDDPATPGSWERGRQRGSNENKKGKCRRQQRSSSVLATDRDLRPAF